MHKTPENDLIDLEGNLVSLESYRGKLVLLVFMRWLG
jgi:peroxiredoxin